MASIDFYTEAHLFVSAIRVLEYQQTRPPSVDDICEILSLSLEEGHRICRRLSDFKVIDQIEGAYGTRLSISDHLKLEEIPREMEENGLSEALKKFQSERKQITEKVESIKAEQDEKKKNLFAELEKQLKDGMGKKRQAD